MNVNVFEECPFTELGFQGHEMSLLIEVNAPDITCKKRIKKIELLLVPA